MLQLMRDKAKSWVTFIVVGIIAFMMAITGLETLAPNPNNPDVAKVNGKEITRADLAQAVERQRRALIQQMGDQFDPTMLDEKFLREAVLKSLIDRALMLQDAEDSEMEVGTEALDRMIVSMQEFQQDGSFSQERFQMMVRSYGMTPLQFKNMLREESLLIQLRSGLTSTEFVTRAELDRLNALEKQTRDISWLILSAEKVRETVQLTDDEINAYYEANSDRFMTSEQVIVSYVELKKEDLANAVEVSEDDVQSEYQARIEQLKEDATAEQQVSTILIATGGKRTLEEARARASEIEGKLKDGADFADLAKEYSDDPVTASKGGDMGLVQVGFFGDDFDDAISGLDVGGVSAPVETDFGLQILTVTNRKGQDIPALEDLRASIESSLKAREVDDLYLQQSRLLADISFESADLGQPAEQLGLVITNSEPFGRQGGIGITANQQIVSAAYSDDVLELGANSELVEVSPEHAVVVRVSKHLKPELMPLPDVREGIVSILRNQKSEAQMKSHADELVTKLKEEGANKQLIATADSLSWVESAKTTRVQQGVPRQLLQTAFKMSHPGSSVAYDTTVLPNGDLALIALTAINPGVTSEADEQRLRGLGQYLANSNGRNLFNEYLRSIKDGAKVEFIKSEE